MGEEGQCRECLRLAVHLRNAITTRDGSKETDARVLIKRHKREEHSAEGYGSEDEVRTDVILGRVLRRDARVLPFTADDGARVVVPLRGEPGQTSNLELSRSDAEQLCARLQFLLDGGRSFDRYARHYGV